jgi:hypothetical protein
VYLALIQGAHGDYGQAGDRAVVTHVLADEIGYPVWFVSAVMARGVLALDLLERGEARAVLEQALREARALGAFLPAGSPPT